MELKHGYYHLIAILVVAIWGLTFISTKVLINHGLTPQEIFLYRFLIAYLGIWVISPKRLFAGNWKDELWLMAGGFFGGSLYFFTENTALGITQASNVAFIICTAPLLTTILSLLFYQSEKATKGLIYGSILALIGVGLVVGCLVFVLVMFKGDVVAGIFSTDASVIQNAFDYLKGFAPETIVTAILFSMIGYFNGNNKTVWVMIQGLVQTLLVRLPLAYYMSIQPNASLTKIGLAAPVATVTGIILNVGFFIYLNRKEKAVTSPSS